MADRDIHIPFGPDKTNGAGIEPVALEGGETEQRDPFAEPTPEDIARLDQSDFAYEPVVERVAVEPDALMPAVEPMEGLLDAVPSSEQVEGTGLTDEQAAEQGMDEMQMSILALKDSIGQGRELKARKKEREELADALEADHAELADREDILLNYTALASEQDAIAVDASQRREAQQVELAQVTAELTETEDALARMREYHAEQLKPLESDLGRVRATADQAKNDERSRKGELNAAEKELSRADDNDANTMAIARHRQAKSAYDDARKRSEQSKEQLAQAQRAYDDARTQADEAEGPLERRIEDLTARSTSLKESMGQLGEELSAARKRRQYIDTVYQYPAETEKLRREVEEAERAALEMDRENDALREQLAESKRKARKAKVAIGIVIAIIVVFIVTWIIVSNR